MSGANTEILNPSMQGFQGGSVAEKLLMNDFKVEALRPQTTLRKDEWLAFDNRLIQVAQERLTGIQDLVSRGLTYSLPNALGTTMLEWETVSDMDGAQTSMGGVTQGQNDRIDYGLTNMPIPLVHKEFTLNIRALEASRNKGQPLDTTQVALATRKVVETLESTLFLGTTVLGSNKPIYGYTTAPNRSTGSLSASWTVATGAQMVTDVQAMISAAQNDHMYGPYIIYVSRAAFTHMSDDYKAESDKTILSRLLEIPGIADIRASENMPDNQVVLVQMTSDVIDLIDGIQPTLVQWETQGGMVLHFKVIAIMPPRVKSDYAEQSGIVHYSV